MLYLRGLLRDFVLPNKPPEVLGQSNQIAHAMIQRGRMNTPSNMRRQLELRSKSRAADAAPEIDELTKRLEEELDIEEKE